MALQSGVTPYGWEQYDDSAALRSGVTPNTWLQIKATGGAIVPPTLISAQAINVGATVATPQVTFSRP